VLAATVRRSIAAAASVSLAAGLFIVASPARAATSLTDDKIVSANGENAVPLGHGRMAEQGGLSFVLAMTEYSGTPFVYVRDTTSTSVSQVALPEGATPGYWGDASYAVSSAGDLWTLSGGGPVYVRRYHLSGSPLPTSATLVSTTVFGDTDSRAGALTILASGAVVGVWHQQAYTGPNGLGIAYWNGSAWSSQTISTLATKASKQAVVQHPGDGSVWVFSDADAYHMISAVHLSEASGGLQQDWVDASYIDVATYGDFGPDPENPDIEAATDPSTNTVVLAYEGNHRQTFQTSSGATEIGSYPVVARIPAAGALTFTSLPIWVERVAPLGVIARTGEVWLAYHPLDTTTLAFANVAASRLATASGAWDTAIPMGTEYDSLGRIGFGLTRVEFTGRMADDVLHRYSTQAAATSSSTSSTTSTTVASSGTTSTKGGGKKH